MADSERLSLHTPSYHQARACAASTSVSLMQALLRTLDILVLHNAHCASWQRLAVVALATCPLYGGHTDFKWHYCMSQRDCETDPG